MRSLASVLRRLAFGLATCLAAVPLACAAPSAEEGSDDGALTSNHAHLLELEFEGEVVARADEPARQAVLTQFQYLSGLLSRDNAGAQIRLVQLLETDESPAGARKTVRYKVALPLAWPKRAAVPESYDLVLPRDVADLPRFNRTYDGACGRSEYGQDRFWYNYDPRAAGCTFDEADVVRATATVRPHPRETQDRYPEYDKVWEDDRLDVVMVNGVIGTDNPQDESYREIEAILSRLSVTLSDVSRTEAEPTATVRKNQTLTGKAEVDGRMRDVVVHAINVHEVETARADFDAVYGPLSAEADLLVYSGHSGLGRHIKSLLARTEVKAGQYQVMYLYGCNTLEYVGTDLFERKTAANGAEADPEGTKFLDIVSTARPAYGDNGRSTLALVNAMLGARKSYNEILAQDFASSHLTVIFGEEDNTFEP
jgi:hypothetical protein